MLCARRPLLLALLSPLFSSLPAADVTHREALRDAAKALYVALKSGKRNSNKADDIANLTPDEEVRLLHIME